LISALLDLPWKPLPVVPPIFALPHPQPLSFERRGG
jgi:hypothetical protein